MKYAIQIKESYTRTVIVEASDYNEAVDNVVDAYTKGTITLNADNSSVEIECIDDTQEYLKIFGNDQFEKMDVLENLIKKEK